MKGPPVIPPRRLATHAAAALFFLCLAVPAAPGVTIDWVTVGDPGNAADTTGFGAVTSTFKIMTFEFTNSQYAAFLNAVDPDGTNPNSIYNGDMGSNVRGGITNTGTTSGSRYAVKSNMGDKPVTYVSWFQAARVANWVNNGAHTYGTSDATAAAPQNVGAYALGTATSGTTPARNLSATVWIPTENEWYKAAY
jgi:sulfatase modifying factor 1